MGGRRLKVKGERLKVSEVQRSGFWVQGSRGKVKGKKE